MSLETIFVPELLPHALAMAALVGGAAMPAIVIAARWAWMVLKALGIFAILAAASQICGDLAKVLLSKLGLGLVAITLALLPAPAAAEGLPAPSAGVPQPGAAPASTWKQKLKKWLPSRVKLPQPTWLPELAVRLIILKKTLDNGQKVEEAVRIAETALAEVDQIRRELEAGRRMTAAELATARARLETTVVLLEALAARLAVIEARTEDHDRRIAEHLRRIKGISDRVRRRGCPRFHAYDWSVRRCIDRR
jgi:hypothetical protein